MDWLAYVIASIFALVGLGCLVLIVLALPGAWIMLALAVIIEMIDGLWLSDHEPVTFGWTILLICTAIAGVGELVELIASMAGAKYSGSSNRGMWGALIGGILGAIILTPTIPIPVVGTLIGALIGTFGGAIIGELSLEDAKFRGTVKPAIGATIGRAFGTGAKLCAAIVIWLTLTVAAFW